MITIGVKIKTPINLNGIKWGVRKRYINYAERLFNEYVRLSPVLTGSFRASWRVKADKIDYSITVGGSKEAPLPPPTFPSIRTRFKLGDTLYISNSTPYALRLDHGWSNQAPMGIVRVALTYIKP